MMDRGTRKAGTKEECLGLTLPLRGSWSKAASRASRPLHIQLASSALLTFRLLGQALMRDSPGGRQSC